MALDTDAAVVDEKVAQTVSVVLTRLATAVAAAAAIAVHGGSEVVIKAALSRFAMPPKRVLVGQDCLQNVALNKL